MWRGVVPAPPPSVLARTSPLPGVGTGRPWGTCSSASHPQGRPTHPAHPGCAPGAGQVRGDAAAHAGRLDWPGGGRLGTADTRSRPSTPGTRMAARGTMSRAPRLSCVWARVLEGGPGTGLCHGLGRWELSLRAGHVGSRLPMVLGTRAQTEQARTMLLARGGRGISGWGAGSRPGQG